MKFVSRTKPMAVPYQIHTYTELRQQIHDDLRIQHPRMGPAKWRVPHVRFLRSAPHGAARHFDAKEIHLVYRCSHRAIEKGLS